MHLPGIHTVMPPAALLCAALPWASSHGGTDGAPALAGRRVLVVEDEAMLAFEIELAIGDADAEAVGPAGEIDEALALIEAEGAAGIDAAILDVDLHGRDVFPVAERLEAAGIPFLFHTGHGTREMLNARFGAAPVCIKPTLMEDLIAQVARLIEG